MCKENFLAFLSVFVLLGCLCSAASYGDLEQPKESELLWNQSMQILADLSAQLESQSEILKTASKHSGVLDIELTKLEKELGELKQSKAILESQHQRSLMELHQLKTGIEDLEKTLAIYKNTLTSLRERLKRKRTNSFLIGLGIGAIVAIGGVLLIK